MGWVLIGAGLLGIVIAWLGRIGKLPRNHFAGIRLPSTMRSDRAWAAAQRAGAAMEIVAGLIVVVLGVRVLMGGNEAIEGKVWWYLIPVFVALIVAAVQAGRAAKAANRDGHAS